MPNQIIYPQAMSFTRVFFLFSILINIGVCESPQEALNPWPGQRLAIVEYPARTRVAATKDGERYAFPARAGKNYALLTDGRNP